LKPMTAPRNKIIGCVLAFLTALAFIIFLTAPRTCPADETVAADSPAEKIHITSDRLVADQNSQFVFFSGNVKAIQGATTIFSDSVSVYYTDARNATGTYTQDSISKIIASGNVRIEFDDKTAYCDQAVYMTNNKSLTLSGKDARVESHGNFISGEKITIYQLTGQIIVDGSEEKRVQAVFQPTKKISMPDLK